MYGTYISASGADAFNKYLEVISNNMANVDSPGFRRELPVIKARFAEAIEQGEAYPNAGTINDVGGGVQLQETRTSFERGQARSTGVDSDLMLGDPRGDHFFVVRRDGEDFLTRAGNFYFDKEGSLRTQSGEQVLSADGGPVVVDDPNQAKEFRRDGSVFQPANGVSIQLAIVRPDSLDQLTHKGSNLFKTDGQLRPVPPEGRNVRPGFLELSSSRPIQEMVDMIKVTRSYEANIRMIQQQDQISESLLTRVLRS